MVNQLITRVVHCALTNQRKTLAWCASEDNVYVVFLDCRALSNLLPGYIDNAFANRFGLRKVEFVSSTMDGVNLDRSNNIKTSGFKAKT